MITLNAEVKVQSHISFEVFLSFSNVCFDPIIRGDADFRCIRYMIELNKAPKYSVIAGDSTHDECLERLSHLFQILFTLLWIGNVRINHDHQAMIGKTVVEAVQKSYDYCRCDFDV